MQNYAIFHYKERCLLEGMLKDSISIMDIADVLRVHRTSIYNEIKRANMNKHNYDAYAAHMSS